MCVVGTILYQMDKGSIWVSMYWSFPFRSSLYVLLDKVWRFKRFKATFCCMNEWMRI
jgi:hypothetical protein